MRRFNPFVPGETDDERVARVEIETRTIHAAADTIAHLDQDWEWFDDAMTRLWRAKRAASDRATYQLGQKVIDTIYRDLFKRAERVDVRYPDLRLTRRLRLTQVPEGRQALAFEFQAQDEERKRREVEEQTQERRDAEGRERREAIERDRRARQERRPARPPRRVPDELAAAEAIEKIKSVFDRLRAVDVELEDARLKAERQGYGWRKVEALQREADKLRAFYEDAIKQRDLASNPRFRRSP